MARKSNQARDAKRAKMIEQYAAKRRELKELGDLEGLAKLPQYWPSALALQGSPGRVSGLPPLPPAKLMPPNRPAGWRATVAMLVNPPTD